MKTMLQSFLLSIIRVVILSRLLLCRPRRFCILVTQRGNRHLLFRTHLTYHFLRLLFMFFFLTFLTYVLDWTLEGFHDIDFHPFHFGKPLFEMCSFHGHRPPPPPLSNRQCGALFSDPIFCICFLTLPKLNKKCTNLSGKLSDAPINKLYHLRLK